MIQYQLSQKFPHNRFLQVEAKFKPTTTQFTVKLPDWRPGRYQLGNFSKYLRNFKAYNRQNEKIPATKTSKNSWDINCKDEFCTIKYEIYTSVIDGGSTFVDEEHWYLNFINCLIYQPEKMHDLHQVKLNIPNDWTIACGLKQDKNLLTAHSFYELVDSPALAGKSLQHLQYSTHQVNFHLWFRGKVDLKNQDQILNDFKKFTAYQVEVMGVFESDDYHFLFQIPNEKAYHGVEHLNSTCIVLGPADSFHTESFYDNFLGISSHELFHYWNIIRIRPEEMYPYNFDHENYFTTGYVAEGVTTYYGDLFLVRSGVKNMDWYIKELNQLLNRHFENYGRFNTSVAESSWDLWLDGYEAGIPDRKVSIYVKGALIALILDLKIILTSTGEKSLDNVMRKLWSNFYKKDKGYSPENYLETAEEVIGHSLKEYSKDYIDGCKPIEAEVKNLLSQFGFEMELKASENIFTQHFGLKTNEGAIVAIAPNSPAEKVFRIGDRIVSFDNQKFDPFEESAEFDDNTDYKFQFFRDNYLREAKVQSNKEGFYSKYLIKVSESINQNQKLMRKKWLNV